MGLLSRLRRAAPAPTPPTPLQDKFTLEYTAQAERALKKLRADAGQAVTLRAVEGALVQLKKDPDHPSLNVHPWRSEKCPHGKTKYEAYAQNHTPGAWRIWFCYVPKQRGVIQIISIGAHP